MEDQPTYINEYHRELSKQLAEKLAKQPSISLTEFQEQVKKLKEQSSQKISSGTLISK